MRGDSHRQASLRSAFGLSAFRLCLGRSDPRDVRRVKLTEDSGPTSLGPFVSGDGSTGLGLAIAKELSTALGGRIELRSQLGRGSRFELVLPT